MLNLSDVLRNLLYHGSRLPRQLGGLTTLAVIAGIATADGRLAVFAPIERSIHIVVYAVGVSVMLNVVLRHGNELLERLIREQRTAQHESRRMAALLKKLLGAPVPPRRGTHQRRTVQRSRRPDQNPRRTK